jgi:UDP-glucose 4-epimerase
MKFNKLSGKHILVTGGTGQIGSHIVEKLLTYDSEVSILCRKITSSRGIDDLVNENRISFLKCDLAKESDILKIKNSLKDVNLIVHLSSIMSPTSSSFFEDAVASVNLNIKGTINLLKYTNLSLEYLCYASSMAVYGTPLYLPVDENCPTRPLDAYGASKLTTEKYLQLYSEEYGVPVTILRYSSVYGPRNRTKRAIPTFINNVINDERPIIYGDGSVVRDYIYVSDVADATFSAIQRRKNGVYNIGLGKGHSVKEVVDKILKISGKYLKPVYKDTPKDFDFVYNISRAKNEFGYNPKVDLERGLKNEMAWHSFNVRESHRTF